MVTDVTFVFGLGTCNSLDMSVPRRCALVVALAGAVGACNGLIGIEDITADSVVPKDGGRSPVDVGSSAVDGSSDDTGMDGVDSAPPPIVFDGETPRRRVFLTSSTWRGDLGNSPGLTGADAICSSAAHTAGLGMKTRWHAWMSGGGMDAVKRLDFDGLYVTVTNDAIAAGLLQLEMGTLQRPIDVTEYGERVVNNDTWVWTGTLANGQGSTATCSDFTFGGASFTIFGTAGSFGQSAMGKWTDNGAPPGYPALACDTYARLYCFEQSPLP